jgi:hypothetical protein
VADPYLPVLPGLWSQLGGAVLSPDLAVHVANAASLLKASRKSTMSLIEPDNMPTLATRQSIVHRTNIIIGKPDYSYHPDVVFHTQ